MSQNSVLPPRPGRNERGENPPDNLGAPCAPELGKDAFHRVPDFARNEWDAVERVLTISEDRFRGRIEERGIPNKNTPPLPSPLLHFAEEREKFRSLDES